MGYGMQDLVLALCMYGSGLSVVIGINSGKFKSIANAESFFRPPRPPVESSTLYCWRR
ncbi:hypothetical protein [uncultured Victivallis sp.]|uniref:hypothetical protein n=1 Tax=uncultured Victivallis sp. TaxID=354118 RepID=UPI00345D4885